MLVDASMKINLSQKGVFWFNIWSIMRLEVQLRTSESVLTEKYLHLMGIGAKIYDECFGMGSSIVEFIPKRSLPCCKSH